MNIFTTLNALLLKLLGRKTQEVQTIEASTDIQEVQTIEAPTINQTTSTDVTVFKLDPSRIRERALSEYTHGTVLFRNRIQETAEIFIRNFNDEQLVVSKLVEAKMINMDSSVTIPLGTLLTVHDWPHDGMALYMLVNDISKHLKPVGVGDNKLTFWLSVSDSAAKDVKIYLTTRVP